MLSIFIDCMGGGFSDVLLEYENVSDKKNYFKQLRHQMNQGNKNAYYRIKNLFDDTLRHFADGEFDDRPAKYCHKNASDKYENIFYGLWLSLHESNEDFFYEKSEDVIAYLVTKWLRPLCKREKSPNGEKIIESQSDKYWKPDDEWIEQVEQTLRPEYNCAITDVLSHFQTEIKENKTFYKWGFDEFYNSVSDSSTTDKIIRYVFGKGEAEKDFKSTIKKLKYEKGKHNWGTFDKLFQNELNDDDLMELLNDKQVLKAYQIFQSRMLMAYFLENLRDILPDYVDKNNAEKIWEILIQTTKEDFSDTDLKAEFLSPNYDEKNKAYAESAERLFYSATNNEFNTALENLDKNCPATNLFCSFAILYRANRTHSRPILSNYEELLQNCKDNEKYIGEFVNYRCYDLEGILW